MYVNKFVDRTFGSVCSPTSNPEHYKAPSNNENNSFY